MAHIQKEKLKTTALVPEEENYNRSGMTKAKWDELDQQARRLQDEQLKYPAPEPKFPPGYRGTHAHKNSNLTTSNCEVRDEGSTRIEKCGTQEERFTFGLGGLWGLGWLLHLGGSEHKTLENVPPKKK